MQNYKNVENKESYESVVGALFMCIDMSIQKNEYFCLFA